MYKTLFLGYRYGYGQEVLLSKYTQTIFQTVGLFRVLIILKPLNIRFFRTFVKIGTLYDHLNNCLVQKELRKRG